MSGRDYEGLNHRKKGETVSLSICSNTKLGPDQDFGVPIKIKTWQLAEAERYLTDDIQPLYEVDKETKVKRIDLQFGNVGGIRWKADCAHIYQV